TRARFADWSPAVLAAPASNGTKAPETTTGALDVDLITRVANVARSIRGRGHLAAHLDPLGTAPQGSPGLELIGPDQRPPDLSAVPASVVGGSAALGAANAGV